MISIEVNGKKLCNSAKAYAFIYPKRFGKDVSEDFPKPRINAEGKVEADPLPTSTVFKLYEAFRIAADPSLESTAPGEVMESEIDTGDAVCMYEITQAINTLLSEKADPKN